MKNLSEMVIENILFQNSINKQFQINIDKLKKELEKTKLLKISKMNKHSKLLYNNGESYNIYLRYQNNDLLYDELIKETIEIYRKNNLKVTDKRLKRIIDNKNIFGFKKEYNINNILAEYEEVFIFTYFLFIILECLDKVFNTKSFTNILRKNYIVDLIEDDFITPYFKYKNVIIVAVMDNKDFDFFIFDEKNFNLKNIKLINL